MKIRFRFLAVLLLSFFFFSPYTAFQAFATDLPTIGANLAAYQPPTGVQCNVNIPSQYSTIGLGIDAASDGDTVCVGPGTYNEDIFINKSIRLSGSGYNKSKIIGAGQGTTVYSRAANVIIEGFFVQGTGIHGNDSSISISPDLADGIIIRFNWIKSGNSGYALTLDGTNSLIQNSILEGNNSNEIARTGSGNNVGYLNNTFIGTLSGYYALDNESFNSTIAQNVFYMTGNVRVSVVTPWTNIVSENNFNTQNIIQVYNYPYGGTVVAENNWWGDTNPSDNVGQGVEGDIDYTPFALSPFPEYPIPSLNQPPVANAGLDMTGNEGQILTFDGSLSSDPDGTGDIISYEWSFGDGATANGQTVSHTYTDNGNYVATLTVTDSAGASSSDTAQITINNVAPSIGTIIAPSTPVEVNMAITASASFTDLGILDTHTASWDWGDGNITVGTVTKSDGSSSVSDTHTYTSAGVYTITLTVTDDDNGMSTQTFQYVSVYNPTPQGLFTGNRIFSSPAGSYPQNPNLTGQVQFGVTSKYQDTSLIGKVSMNFKVANLEFNSTSLTALVISDGQATLRGTGTVNGSGNYNFLVTGLDGPQDAIRIQIKDQSGTVLYDSQLGAADTATPTASVTGQIIVH
ncbi:PKD domain-containing protein [Candidatus Microgenomates bacterium]|nr:PKD domain-containing protein [Candidatus Microgenomates bacterium]